ncbi:MAG TPA: FHA domain-containing protein [Isosphaeraceae bacterium]|jgi:pSer/pThr/pTyr-binding forkhead associated (FHA) protein
MHNPSDKPLGILRPLGGGDPAPLMKEEVVVGRRPTCDICLDFDNVSGKHCVLRFMNGFWHARDLGSSNGTFVNGQKMISDQVMMPEFELSIAGHLFTIDYEPHGPQSLTETHGVLDEDLVDVRKRTSLMELAGLDTDDKPVRQRRATKPPAAIERLSADEADFDDSLPETFKKPAPKKAKDDGPSDDDFFKLIEEEVK